jgi:hypothetical protein
MVEAAPTVEATGLFERSGQLSALTGMLAAVARTGRGRLALVYGEAGIGKTALVRRFSEEACDPARLFGASATSCSRRARSVRCLTWRGLLVGSLSRCSSGMQHRMKWQRWLLRGSSAAPPRSWAGGRASG